MARVCMLLNNFEPPFGGPELQALNISKKLIGCGHEVLFISKGSGQASDYEVIESIPVYRLNKRGLASVEAIYQLWKLKDKFDIIHVHGVGRLASVAVNFGRKHNKKVYIKVTTAGHIFKPAGKGIKGFIKKLSPFGKRKVELLKKADGMIAISSEILCELKNNGFNEDKIMFIPNGVDTDKFHPVETQEKIRLRSKLGLPLDKTIFLFTGKLTKRKGVDILLNAWLSAKIRADKALLVLVGSGHGQADGLDDWIEKFLKEHSLGSSVIRKGAVDNVNEYLAAADCFVFPSHREGLPNSLLEAMACGLYCLVSPIGGNTDLVRDGETGVVVSNNAVDTWTAAILNSLEQQDSEISRAALNLIEREYSINTTVNRLIETYNVSVRSSEV